MTAEERDIRLENDIIGGQVETSDSGEEMWVITEAMEIHPTPHTPKTDSGTGRTGTELGMCEPRFSGTGEIDGTQRGNGAE